METNETGPNVMGGEMFFITKKTFTTINGKTVLNTVETGRREGFSPPPVLKNLGMT